MPGVSTIDRAGRRGRQVPAGRIAWLCLLLVAAPAQGAPRRGTYANPLDIDYRYNFEQRNEGISYRTGADPVIVRHRGAYYLFLTLANGYWRSSDLVRWTFVTPSRWEATGMVAPAAWSDGKRLYLMPSMMEPGAVYVSDDPDSGRLEFLVRQMPPLPGAVRPGEEGKIAAGEAPPGPWDPALFRDDDGRWFLYWNSSNLFPLYGIEIGFGENRLIYKGRPRPLLRAHPDRHGWERFGRDHSGGLPDGTPVRPYVEGAWMTRVGKRYYLQYGAPGTEYNAYANGTYVGLTPLGPFRYAPYNPVAYKPGGFVQGAGHGSTFRDAHGNWWNSGTPWIGLNWPFERRIAMFPARFHADGQMEVSTRFGDFPHHVPDGRVNDPASLFTGWMLLSYRKPAFASSTMAGSAPDRVTDEDPRTFWVAGANRRGEMVTLDLGGPRTVRAIQVNFADYQSGRFADAPDIHTDFELFGSPDGDRWQRLAATGPERRDRPNAYFELPRPTRARYVRYVHGHVGAARLAIADIRVFGTAGGPPPPTPIRVEARRDVDTRDATISWRPVAATVGYNVLWGTRPDRLTLSYQVWAEAGPRLKLRALNAVQRYWLSVEAFNESGVSPATRPVPIASHR